MAQILDNQGAIKSSEIYTDSPLNALGTVNGEDNLTVLKQLTQLSLDSFFKQRTMPFSLGYINWNGSEIDFSQDARGNDIYLRILQTDNDTLRTIDIVLKGSTVANTANEFKSIALAHNELLYVELTRDNLASSGGTLQLQNAVGGGSLVTGKTVKKVLLSPTTGLEQIKSLVTGDGSSLFIPICFRNTWTDGIDTFDDLLWCVNEERWIKNTKNMLGQAVAKSFGGAIINFLETSDPSISWDAEVGIQNILTYNDSSALPIDASGGSVNSGFIFDTTAVPSEVLSGDNSFVIEKSGLGSMQGHGIAFDVQIFAGYRTREVVFKCLFNKISGTYNDGDIQVFVIADPNGTPKLITPLNNKIGAMMGEMTATFFPFAGIEDYRICFHVTTTNPNQFRVALDDIKLNPIYYTTADAFTGPQPAGTIAAFGGGIDPDGWMICDGRSLSRIAYPELFANIGTSFGSNSSATFNIPDFRGAFLRGADISPSGLPAANLDLDKLGRTALKPGGNTGDKIGSFQNDANKQHDHGGSTGNFNSGFSGAGSDSNGAGIRWWKGWNQGDDSSSGQNEVNDIQWLNLNHTHSIPSDGGNESRPKNVNVGYIIKLQNDRKNTVLSSARVEYSSNSNISSATSDNSAFFNGVEGSALPAVPVTVAGSVVQTTRNVSFLSAITTSDTMKLQVDYGSGGLYWVDAAALFPKIEYPTITVIAGTTASNNQITGIANISGISIGMPVVGSGIPASTTITNINRTTGVVTISNNATVTNATNLLQFGAVTFGMFLRPNLSKSTEAIVTFGNAGASPDVPWSSVSSYRWRVVKATNNLAIEVMTKDNAGVVKLFAGTSVPTGWLECNGQSLLISAYPDLFSAIGTSHGSASPLHFNVPDMRGVTVKGPVGFDSVVIGASSIAGQNIVVPGHQFQRTGIPVQVSGTAMPLPLAATTDYYVIVVDANTIKLATTRANALAGTAITMASTNANPITMSQFLDTDFSITVPMTTGATSNTYQESAFGLGSPGSGGAPYNESGVFLRTMLMKYIIKS